MSHLRDKLLQGGGKGETESATPPSPSPLCGWRTPAPPVCWGSGAWRSRWLCRRIVWSFSRTIRRSVWTCEFALAYTSCTQSSVMCKTKPAELGWKPNSTISLFSSFVFHCYHDGKQMFIWFLTRMWSSSLLVCISCFSSSTIFSIASFSTSSSRSDICGWRQWHRTGERRHNITYITYYITR